MNNLNRQSASTIVSYLRIEAVAKLGDATRDLVKRN